MVLGGLCCVLFFLYCLLVVYLCCFAIAGFEQYLAAALGQRGRGWGHDLRAGVQWPRDVHQPATHPGGGRRAAAFFGGMKVRFTATGGLTHPENCAGLQFDVLFVRFFWRGFCFGVCKSTAGEKKENKWRLVCCFRHRRSGRGIVGKLFGIARNKPPTLRVNAGDLFGSPSVWNISCNTEWATYGAEST